jgi:hypothetical protein
MQGHYETLSVLAFTAFVCGMIAGFLCLLSLANGKRRLGTAAGTLAFILFSGGVVGMIVFTELGFREKRTAFTRSCLEQGGSRVDWFTNGRSGENRFQCWNESGSRIFLPGFGDAEDLRTGG